VCNGRADENGRANENANPLAPYWAYYSGRHYANEHDKMLLCNAAYNKNQLEERERELEERERELVISQNCNTWWSTVSLSPCL